MESGPAAYKVLCCCGTSGEEFCTEGAYEEVNISTFHKEEMFLDVPFTKDEVEHAIIGS